jgi:CspA family cold shock protein
LGKDAGFNLLYGKNCLFFHTIGGRTFIYTLRRELLSKSKGTIKFFNVQKGFGFITPDNGGKDLFVHANNVHGDPKSLREGQKVEFVEGPGRKGPEATDVRII